MNQTARFQRTIENFTCAVCGAEVEGDGFTNHCPACLWSKHVDVNPGDRAERCTGLMEPVHVEILSSARFLTHRCLNCKIERRIRLRDDDSIDAIVELSRQGG